MRRQPILRLRRPLLRHAERALRLEEALGVRLHDLVQIVALRLHRRDARRLQLVRRPKVLGALLRVSQRHLLMRKLCLEQGMRRTQTPELLARRLELAALLVARLQQLVVPLVHREQFLHARLQPPRQRLRRPQRPLTIQLGDFARLSTEALLGRALASNFCKELLMSIKVVEAEAAPLESSPESRRQRSKAIASKVALC